MDGCMDVWINGRVYACLLCKFFLVRMHVRMHAWMHGYRWTCVYTYVQSYLCLDLDLYIQRYM